MKLKLPVGPELDPNRVVIPRLSAGVELKHFNAIDLEAVAGGVIPSYTAGVELKLDDVSQILTDTDVIPGSTPG